MTSLDALMDVVRAQMNDARRALIWAEMCCVRAPQRLAGLDDDSAGAPVVFSRRAGSGCAVNWPGLSADEAAFAREAEALRGLLVEAHAELDKLERLTEREHCARERPGGKTAPDHR